MTDSYQKENRCYSGGIQLAHTWWGYTTQTSTDYSVKNIGGYIYEVSFDHNKMVSVDLLNRKCTYREWKFLGISCCHAMRCISCSNDDPMTYVDEIFKRHTFELSYR